MKTRLFAVLAVSAGFVLPSCDKPETSSSAPPAKKEPVEPAVTKAVSAADDAVDGEPTAAEKKLASRVQELEAHDLAIQQQIEDERLATADAEIAKEQELLQKEREAWALEQQLADAKAAADDATDAAESAVENASTGAVVPGDYQTFYDDLAPQGSWFNSPDYGYVWQPSVAVSDTLWRPYTCGRWACADQGWTWCSDEPFGWACYHYGRWCRLKGRGWIWVPGDQWAPAWVGWRKTDTSIGWCPLPPETVYDRDCTYGPTVDTDCGISPGCYVFMPVKHFDKPVLTYCEVPSVCLNIYHSSINITNCVVRRHRVECQGPAYQWICDRVRHTLPRYTMAFGAGRPDRHHDALIEDNHIRFYAPKVYAPWNATLHPAHAKASLAGVEVERAAGGVPGKLINRFQEQRLQRGKDAENLTGNAGRKIVEHQKRLASLEKDRENIKEQVREEGRGKRPATGPSTAATRPNPAATPDAKGSNGPIATVVPAHNPEDPQLIAAREELARLRAQRESRAQEVRRNAPAVVPAAPAVVENKEQRRLADSQAQLNARQEQLAKLRAEREAAARQPVQPATGMAENGSEAKPVDPRASAPDDAARREQANQNERAKELAERQRAAVEEQRRTNEAASANLEKQNKDRAALAESRRQQEENQNRNAKEQLAKLRADQEQQRRTADAAAKEADRQKSERAALEDRKRQEAANQQAQAREQLARERAAFEQQRRQAEEQAKAREQAAIQQREAMQRDALQRQAAAEQASRQAAEQAARQREAMENQRRAAEENNRQENNRRQAEENSRRQAEDNNRRQAEESRRQAEENNRRQAEENSRKQAEESRRQADQRAKDAADQNNRKGGR